MGKLDRYFFQYLPEYFKLNDTYPVGDKGLLERYLDVFQVIAEQYVTDLEGMVDLQSPLTTNDNFLNYVASFYGDPPDTFGDVQDYKELLSNINHINRNRGTMESLRNFFKVMGTDATITKEYATYFLHDNLETHDDTDVHHDGYCYPCVNISVDVLDPTNILTVLTAGILTQDTRRIIQSILIYFLPVNSVLKEFAYNGTTKDISLTSNNLIALPVPGGALPY